MRVAIASHSCAPSPTLSMGERGEMRVSSDLATAVVGVAESGVMGESWAESERVVGGGPGAAAEGWGAGGGGAGPALVGDDAMDARGDARVDSSADHDAVRNHARLNGSRPTRAIAR